MVYEKKVVQANLIITSQSEQKLSEKEMAQLLLQLEQAINSIIFECPYDMKIAVRCHIKEG